MDKHLESIIRPILDQRMPQCLLEIGVCEGAMTLPLLRWCKKNNARLTSLDPVAWSGHLPEEIRAGYGDYIFKNREAAAAAEIAAPYLEQAQEEGLLEYWDCVKDLSLNYLSSAGGKFDAVFIDGDHNFYTVYNELLHLDDRTTDGAVIFLHDVAGKWPRQDQYYDSTNVPAEFIGGSRQGVLTAIDAFLEKHKGRKEGILAHSEEFAYWLTRHPVVPIVSRLRSALRVLRRGYDHVWIQCQLDAFQRDAQDADGVNADYVFRILSGEHFGLGLLEKRAMEKANEALGTPRGPSE